MFVSQSTSKTSYDHFSLAVPQKKSDEGCIKKIINFIKNIFKSIFCCCYPENKKNHSYSYKPHSPYYHSIPGKPPELKKSWAELAKEECGAIKTSITAFIDVINKNKGKTSDKNQNENFVNLVIKLQMFEYCIENVKNLSSTLLAGEAKENLKKGLDNLSKCPGEIIPKFADLLSQNNLDKKFTACANRTKALVANIRKNLT